MTTTDVMSLNQLLHSLKAIGKVIAVVMSMWPLVRSRCAWMQMCGCSNVGLGLRLGLVLGLQLWLGVRLWLVSGYLHQHLHCSNIHTCILPVAC